jgi:hypothetical protein
MKTAIELTRRNFQTSCSKTPEYIAWHQSFRRAFIKFLQSKGVTRIDIGSPNHFDMSGFFTLGNQAWYFRIEDIRWSKNTMLVRTAKHYKDYTGGMNNFVSLADESSFIRDFENVTRHSQLALF